jgi:hypothetical protein
VQLRDASLSDEAAIKISWVADRINFLRFRLRATRYALSLERAPAIAAIAKTVAASVKGAGAAVGVLATLGVFQAATGALRSLATPRDFVEWGAAFGLVLALLVCTYVLLSYYSSIPRIIDWASANERDAFRLRQDMAAGMRNPDGYRQIRAIYKTALGSANSRLESQGYYSKFYFVNQEGLTTDATVSRYAAVAVMPTDGQTSLSNVLGDILERPTAEWDYFTRTFAQPRQQLMRKWRVIDGKQLQDDESGFN